MSGITGIFHLDGRPASSEQIRHSLDGLAARGPDASNLWIEGETGLGHRMLWTTPESLRETQPLVEEGGLLALTADARIDNRDDLAREMDLTGEEAGQLTDAAWILAAYRRWGLDAPVRLLGDFAFALWDAREQRLFCARDALGARPFFYTHRPGRFFAFCSELNALFSLADIPRTINEVRVADYLGGILEDQASTFFEQVLRLPAAHAMTVSPDGVRSWSYWQLDPEAEVRFARDEDYAAAFRERFEEAVRCRMRSAFPIGSTLSGGLDSSSVAAMASDLLPPEADPLHTFSAVFSDLPERMLRVIDERAYMERVASRKRITPHFLPMNGLSPLKGAQEAVRRHGQPFEMRNVYLEAALYEEARRQGVRVLLDGLEGDLTVSHGFGFLNELAARGDWNRFAVEVKALVGRLGGTSRRYVDGIGMDYLAERARTGRRFSALRDLGRLAGPLDLPFSYVARQAASLAAPDLVRRGWRRLRGRSRPEEDENALVNPALAARTGLPERRRLVEAKFEALVRTERQDHWTALTAGYGPVLLETVDRNAAAFSLDLRHPFFDRRLVAFCLSLPPEQKLRNGWVRYVVRQAMAGVVPDEVRWRAGKANLSPFFYSALGKEQKTILSYLHVNSEDVLNSYVNLSVARTAFEKGAVDALWPVIVLAEWLRLVENGALP